MSPELVRPVGMTCTRVWADHLEFYKEESVVLSLVEADFMYRGMVKRSSPITQTIRVYKIKDTHARL